MSAAAAVATHTTWENPHKKFNVADALCVSNIITRK
jgi:hypothetical protein